MKRNLGSALGELAFKVVMVIAFVLFMKWYLPRMAEDLKIRIKTNHEQPQTKAPPVSGSGNF